MPSKSAKDFLPKKINLISLRKAARNCEGCHLYQYSHQTVFGEGPARAEVMIVGEIAGDKEDQLGRPFVGPAGVFLRKLIAAADLDFHQIYFTNVVKHFKFKQVQQRRLHRSPLTAEIKACKPWLEAEMAVIKPRVILCLGAVAAKTLINKNFSLTRFRGKWFKLNETTQIIASFHPAAVLRAPDHDAREQMKNKLLKDLQKISDFLKEKT